MWLAWRRVAGVISNGIRRGMKAASIPTPAALPIPLWRYLYPLSQQWHHGCNVIHAEPANMRIPTTYTSGEFKESEGKKNGASEWILFYFFVRSWSTHNSRLTLASRWCRPSAHASLGCFICLPAFLPLISHLSPSYTVWWQAFQTEGNGLALKWNWACGTV